jgi:pyruvate dehydrogenase E2 component (dihydrolipoamide acetyltransferase)
MTDAIELRRKLNASFAADERIRLNDLVIKACALALVKYPAYNATFQGDHLRVATHVDIGIAVAMPEGLAVPAVLECERKSLSEIARDARSLASRVREGTLKQREYTGTFTISNLGMFDVDAFTAIIVSPQVGVLALGSMQATPIVHRGDVVVRQVMSATLSTDHRAAGGAEAAQFAGEIKRLLEEPAQLA